MVDKPDKDADADEIARWMKDDFWESVTEGMQEVIKDKNED